MEKKERKKESINLEELDKVNGGLMMLTPNHGSTIVADKYTCPECFQVFDFKSEINIHLKEVHGYKEEDLL